MICAGFFFGIPELYAIALAAMALVLAARLWVSARHWDLKVERAAHPSRVPAGSEARVELFVTNPDHRRSPPVVAADPFDGGRRWARFAIAPVEAGDQRAASYRLPTSQRGVFRLGPLELTAADPFGIARATRRGGPDASVTVHPAFETLSIQSLPSYSELDSSHPVPAVGRGGHEFFSLRPYDPGDDLRMIHWRSSARIDDLVVRQPESRRQTRLTVVVDLRAQVHDAASLEAVLSACASLALSGLAEGLQVRVVTSGGLDTGYSAGPGEAHILLDALAAAATHRGSALSSVGQRPSARDPVLLITTDGASDEDLAAVLGRASSLHSRLIVFERRSRPRDPVAALADTLGIPGSPEARHPTIRIPVGSSLRRAWDGARW
jgi:uncharacterized protein (DUF58 family)